MTREEAIILIDELLVCIKEHPIIADWLVEIEDRKTENSSGKPNNCETCKWWEEDTNFCHSKADSDDHSCHYEQKTEPQTELVNDSQILVKDLVDGEFNPYDEDCMRCKHLKLKCEFIPTYCKFESRDEPQTERSNE